MIAPAKVNLFLHVTGKRGDGYHEIESLVGFASEGDILEFTPLEQDHLRLEISGVFSSLLGDTSPEKNLVYRAALLLKEQALSPCGISIRLYKNIPVAAGLGGGSSDAAATLLYLNHLWDCNLSAPSLAALGVSLGADIPVCLNRQFVMMEGIGEKVTPLSYPGLESLPGILINPLIPLATPDIFRNLTQRSLPLSPAEKYFPSLRSRDEWWEYLKDKRNDLEEPALRLLPLVGEIITILAQSKGCRYARMTGSGATCFGLYESKKEAEEAMLLLQQQFPSWWIKQAMIG